MNVAGDRPGEPSPPMPRLVGLKRWFFAYAPMPICGLRSAPAIRACATARSTLAAAAIRSMFSSRAVSINGPRLASPNSSHHSFLGSSESVEAAVQVEGGSTSISGDVVGGGLTQARAHRQTSVTKKIRSTRIICSPRRLLANRRGSRQPETEPGASRFLPCRAGRTDRGRSRAAGRTWPSNGPSSRS